MTLKFPINVKLTLCIDHQLWLPIDSSITSIFNRFDGIPDTLGADNVSYKIFGTSVHTKICMMKHGE